MPICAKCGTELTPGANFCNMCGAPVNEQAPVSVPAPKAAPFPPAFSSIPVRYRCANGHVLNGTESQATCAKCGAPLAGGGMIHIYRMGNYVGMLVGMGIYIDGVPYGHLGNKESIRIMLPYGPHTVHMTHTSTRACNDPVFNLTPEEPYVCCKAHFSKAGFAIAVERTEPENMPTA